MGRHDSRPRHALPLGPGGRTSDSASFFRLSSLWFIVSAGAFAIWGGIYHLGPTSHSVATQIGYAPSMFQWEVGAADIAIGILCVLCVRASNRGQWMTAALTVLTVSFFGDGTGHLADNPQRLTQPRLLCCANTGSAPRSR